MNAENKNSKRITVGTIKQIVGLTATECFGVVGMAALNPADEIYRMLKKEEIGDGVRVSINKENRLHIEVFVIMDFGVKAKAVAENLIDTIKYNVEKETGIKVKKVTVYVQSVRV